MEQEEVVRRNVAIAEYMGAEEMWVRKDFDDPHHVDMPWELIGKVKQVPYHEDWSLLMPVVERVVQEFWEGIHSWLPLQCDSPLMLHHRLYEVFWLKEGSEKPLVERMWLAVSDYILTKQNKG